MDYVENHRFIIFCGHGPNALGIIRSLHEKQIAPVMIINKCGPTNYADCSRFVGAKHYVNSSEEAIEVLLNEYGDEKVPPFVFTTDDYHTELLDSHYDRLLGHFYFFNCGESKRLTSFLNKDLQCHVAEESGFVVPAHEVVHKGTLPQSLKYPVITKTISSNEGGWKKDVYLCNNEDELKDAYEHIAAENILLEEYIPKKKEISVHGISVNGGQIVYVPFYTEDESFSSISFGSCLRLRLLSDVDMLSKITTFVQSIRFSGVFNMDFLESQEGQLLFLEINMRSGARNYAVTAGGANLPYLWAKTTVENGLQMDFPLKNSLFVVDEVSDFVEHKRNLKKWLSDIKQADVRLWYYKRDNAPIRFYVFNKIMNVFNKMLGIRKTGNK